MKKIYTFIVVALLCNVQLSTAQNVGIGTNNPLGKLDIVSSNEGLVIPRVSLTGTNDGTTVLTLQNGELVYNTATAGSGSTAVTPGFYHWNGSSWGRLALDGTDDDQDWYEQGTTASPDNINDNIFTHGNVGIGATVPSHKLHVVGDIWAEGKYVVQNSQDGGTERGIYLWNAADTNWGIYMGSSGASRSLSGATATAGAGFSTHAVRLRANNSGTQGFIFENSSEVNLFSIRASDGYGYFAGSFGVGTAPSAKFHVNGSVRLQGISEGSGKVLVSDASGNATWSNELPNNDAGYIWNQNASDQPANFRIDGTGQQSKVIATANGDWFMRGGDDAELRDVNTINTLAVWGRQNADRAGLQLGSDGSFIFGDDGNIGIGTTAPERELEVDGSGNTAYIRIQGAEAANGYAGLEFQHPGGSAPTKTAIVSDPFNSWKRSDLRFILDSGADDNSYDLVGDTKMIIKNSGNVGIGTDNPGYRLTIGSGGSVFGVENSANFVAKNSAGSYETYFWPRWSDNVMYMNYGSGGYRLRNNSSQDAIIIDNDRSVNIQKGVLFDCNDCGSGTTIDGTSNWGDLVIQGRVLSTNSNFHLSPPNGSNVIINGAYNAAGTGSGSDPGLIVEGNGLTQLQGGLETDKRYYYFQRYLSCSCYGPGSASYNLGTWDFCALAHVGFKNNRSNTDEDDDVQCAIYPSGYGGSGETSNYNTAFNLSHDQRPTWLMYFEAYEDTNGVTCAANCITFRHGV